MSVAAIAIDNFLSTSQWDGIQSDISSHLTSPTYSESRNIIHTQINGYIKNKLQSLNIWQDAWEDEIGLFSSLNSIPSGINVESCDPTNGGYHREEGGYIYYIHPAWESTWGGNLKFKNCSVDKIEPKPNRFVWVNPDVWHGIEPVDATASTNRVTVVAWPSGTVEYAGADIIINTST
tara:strand:+ start:512 stop:1045 length:534 start_codon:yes stop_codon:yes gene_type:complete